jgi:hypothetical protein
MRMMGKDSLLEKYSLSPMMPRELLFLKLYSRFSFEGCGKKVYVFGLL